MKARTEFYSFLRNKNHPPGYSGNMKTISIASLLLATILSVCATEEEGGKNKSAGESKSETVKTLVEYKISKTAVHYGNDAVEAKRRYEKSKHAMTADVFRLNGDPTSKQLHLIKREAQVHRFGGGSDADPSSFAIDVTIDQNVAIEEAISKGELFVIYYHYGW